MPHSVPLASSKNIPNLDKKLLTAQSIICLTSVLSNRRPNSTSMLANSSKQSGSQIYSESGEVGQCTAGEEPS